MTIYSSRPPFNDDPFPYLWPQEKLIWTSGPLRSMFSEGDGINLIHDPRPEFDRPQHNRTNSILESLRAGIAADPSNNWFRTFLVTLPNWDHGEVGHARRVLTRLVSLEFTDD